MMTAPTSTFNTQAQTLQWQTNYKNHLAYRLKTSIEYVRTGSPAQVHAHLRSFMTLLDESQRFPKLNSLSLKFIRELHPLPIRWGMGYLWQQNLRFAARVTPRTSEKYSYLIDIAEIEEASGSFETVLNATLPVLKDNNADLILVARACRARFNAYRSMGNAEKADVLLNDQHARFELKTSEDYACPEKVQAWLIFHESRLELLREQGKIEQALVLVNQMIRLDARSGSVDCKLTADLLTRRSTLLWTKSDLPAAITDLNQAIELHTRANDTFNAISLQSNLGLVYWTLGELDKAEKALTTAINFYRKTGSAHLITSDIGNLGLVYFARADFAKAQKLFTEQIEQARKINFFTEYYRGKNNFADVCYYLGEYQNLIDLHAESFDYFKFRERREGFESSVLWIACAEYQLGEHEGALKKMREVLKYSQVNHSQALESIACRCLAQFLPFEERKALLLHALEITRVQGRLLEEAAIYLALAQVEQNEQAQLQTWQRGVGLLERIGAAAWLKGHSPEDPPFIPIFS